MTENLVKTIKREYVYTNDCYSAESVLEMLSGRISDYSEVAPHSVLGMMSPIEYIKKMN
jgi:putative transposase